MIDNKDEKENKEVSSSNTNEKSQQLNLFQEILAKNPDFSATMEIWDLCPKFWFGGVKRVGGKYLNNLKKDFKVRGKDFVVNITPASITEADGTTKHYYPSQREELVEEVIKKLLIQKKESFSQDGGEKIGVSFSLYEVQKELKRMKHGYDLNQIKLAIDVCSKSVVDIKSEETSVSWTSAIFTSVGKKEEIDSKKTKYVVTFSRLVVESINRGTFRPINYDAVMRYKMPLSRWIHRIISHIYTQLGKENPYMINMSTLVNNSPMTEYSKPSQTLKQVIKSLDELVKFGTLENYKIEKIDLNGGVIPKEEERGKKIADAKLYLYAGESFINDVRKANAMKNAILTDEEKPKTSDLEKVKTKLQNSIFGLSKTIIENQLHKIKTMEDVNNILISLEAALEYIQDHKPNNNAAATQKALRELWKPKEKKFEYFGEKGTFKESKNFTLKNDDPLWQKLLVSLKEDFSEAVYDRWLSKLNFLLYEKEEVYLGVESKFLRDWIKREYLEAMKENFKLIDKTIKNIVIEYLPELENKTENS